MSNDKDVTSEVQFGLNYDENLLLIKCICGSTFDHGEFVLTMSRKSASQCPNCGRKLYYTLEVNVFEKRRRRR